MTLWASYIDTYEQTNKLKEAKIVEGNAKNRSEMSYVNIASKKPSYNSKKYFVQFKTKEEYPNWFEENYF